QYRLTPLQEELIADWILEEDARGYPPTHARAQEMASRLLRAEISYVYVMSFTPDNGRKVVAVSLCAISVRKLTTS
ncbi:hypothetical protein K432DRAFT_289973, partial [Lepidopterella palustris CBS 459.81]